MRVRGWLADSWILRLLERRMAGSFLHDSLPDDSLRSLSMTRLRAVAAADASAFGLGVSITFFACAAYVSRNIAA